jgi:hypothetical protein
VVSYASAGRHLTFGALTIPDGAASLAVAIGDVGPRSSCRAVELQC